MGCRVLIAGFRDGYPWLEKVDVGADCRSLECLVSRAGVDVGSAELYVDGRKTSEIPRGCGEAVLLYPKPGVVAAKLLDPNASIDLGEVYQVLAVRGSLLGAGAIVSFVGFVKGLVEGVRVYELYYDALREYAERALYSIALKYSSAPGVRDVAVYHYTGPRRPGDYTVFVIVSAVSRHQAFNTAAMILEEVKFKAPIYKLERREDGEYWILGDHARFPRQKNLEGRHSTSP